MDTISTKNTITITNARVNNLKNVSVSLPRNKLIVITGLSGSGKSSLAFDTLYAEGQRRYVESLSSYARQFLGRMNKPEVDSITGLSPAIAIEQKVHSRNPRSTVGTSTEIYEYLKLLFARIGKTHSPVSENIVKRHQVKDVVDYILKLPTDSTVLILAPLSQMNGRSASEQLSVLMQQGFVRVFHKEIIYRIDEYLEKGIKGKIEDYQIVVDRLRIQNLNEEFSNRAADSVQTAFYEGKGYCVVHSETNGKIKKERFSDRFEADGITFEEPSVNMFTFNNPFGACKTCEGFGSVIGIDEDLVVPNKALSIYDGAIACWKGEKMGEWKELFLRNAHKFDFPIHKPYYSLTKEQKKLLWTGNNWFEGIDLFFKQLEEQSYKIQYRVMLSRYRGKTVCPDCEGTRLRKDANYVKVANKNISEIVLMPLEEAYDFFKNIELNEADKQVAKRLLTEITNRISFLLDVGLRYLTLNRLSNSLSGGESQRINLATSLGSSLVGSAYILDEPSIGLHTRDTERLIKVLKRLRDIGNTVVIVEHDEDIIKAADQVIDIGPLAGRLGGELIFQGTYEEIMKDPNSLTGKYLNGKMSIPVPSHRRKWTDYIEIIGASENNLKNLNVKIPLGIMTTVTGVSGSGKSSLIRGILYPALRKHTGGHADKTGSFGELKGDLNRIQSVEMIDQNPIGRSSRSNPVTYVKAFDEIRQLFADLKLSKTRGYKPGYFSFNVPGGRCDACEGEGTVKIEMQFMADVYLKCDVCQGKRFKEEVLDAKFMNQNVSDILDMTIDEAIEFFQAHQKASSLCNKILSKLLPLQEVGLGYLKMGQSSNTLSGGEAQRIKLAFFLTKGQSEKPTLFIFDEPTTGLHFHDINKLMDAFNALIENGHTLVIIEHNPEVIKSADWVIDLGPDGGDKGGTIVFEGSPEALSKSTLSFTAAAIKDKL
ncbi:MAG: excinuclease ABC subunit UvrA [Bacteroidetes bacterium]|jgi:excinuclease ABC subunit A|nr:excinuclease ABC subunit UvrA [Bacteroidota bacterium]